MGVMFDLIEAHANWERAGGHSPRTVSDRRALLYRFDAELRDIQHSGGDVACGIEGALPTELQAILGDEDWSASTRETYWYCLWSFYTWATAGPRPILSYNPMVEMLKPPPAPRGEPRPLTRPQVEKILTEAASPFRELATIAICSGYRCVELARLRREDCTPDELRVRRGKGNRKRAVPCHPAAWAIIEPLPAGLIAEHLGAHPDPRWISIRAAVHFTRDLGMPGVSMHRLRHTTATWMRAAGADQFLIRKVMGHSSAAYTQIYTGVDDEECRQAVRALTLPIAAAAAN